jgi:hypothetical protein
MEHMKVILPREHGAWGMLFAPLLAGIIVSGFTPNHLLLVLGMLAAYLASHPLIQWLKHPQQKASMKTWAFGYGTAALLFGIPLLLQFPQLMGLAFVAAAMLMVNIQFAVLRQERHMLNNFAAICGLSLGAVAAYYVGQQSFDETAWLLGTLFVAYFFGSALHVKSLIREKNNRFIKRAANWYHGMLIVLPLLISTFYPESNAFLYLALAFSCSSIKVWMTKFQQDVRPLKIGILEIVNTVWFVLVVSILFF